MKTKFIKKSSAVEKSEILTLNKEELNKLEGGLQGMTFIRNPDGTVTIIVGNL